MRSIFLGMLLVLTLQLNAQNSETVDWINENSIKIEDADPDTELLEFKEKTPTKFANAKIFGFGEATHHGKEFFNIKAKFFKYLVETQGVRAFIMEEAYPAESGINEWISGGKGDIQTISTNFTMQPWKTKEVVNLLEWMRNYNLDKPNEEQIRFYGMDIQNVKDINQEIRDFVNKYNVPVNEKLLLIADSSANRQVDYKKSTDWADIQIPKLKEIEQIIQDFQADTGADQNGEFKSVIRALNYLIQYTYYVQHPESEVRDLKMFENVKWIIDNEALEGKAFIWAHNEHINNKEMSYGSGWTSLGGHLKEYYKNDYYSVGFNFGTGKVIGLVTRRNKPNDWEVFEIDKPSRKSYAETLFEVNKDIFFIDMAAALNSDSRDFFSTTKKQLLLGAHGYSGKKRQLVNQNYSEMFDGLIFIKSISVPNYDLKKE
jgi:erythromycin esterase